MSRSLDNDPWSNFR